MKEENKGKNYFELLNSINVSDKTEKKNGLTFLSWAWAWTEVKKLFPDATYNIKKFGENQLPYVYDENTGYMVFTDMTIEGITHEMWLPVLDGANQAMKNIKYTYKVYKYTNGKKVWNNQTNSYEMVDKEVEPATMFDINKTIMRCLTKNIAMFGLGLYIYAGEDLPEGKENPNDTEKIVPKKDSYAKEMLATEKQKEMIKNILNDEELEKTKEKYGNDLEKLDIQMASKIISSKKGNN